MGVQTRTGVGWYRGGAEKVGSFLEVAFERLFFGPPTTSSECRHIACAKPKICRASATKPRQGEPQRLNTGALEDLFEEREMSFRR